MSQKNFNESKTEGPVDAGLASGHAEAAAAESAVAGVTVSAEKGEGVMKKIETAFESALWHSRLVVLTAVVASMLAGFAMFYMATVDAWFMVSHLGEYASPALAIEERNALRGATITHVVEIVDGYLLGTVLLIFALGLYELFISTIDLAKGEKVSGNVLVINSLDDLKNRLAKVILMILIVKFFEHAIGMVYDTPISLLSLAGGIALIGLALYLTHASEGHKR